MRLQSEILRTPDDPRISIDNREILPYRGRVGVFFGGSGGTGNMAAVEYQKLGGRVVMGASSERTRNRGLANVRNLGGDRTTVVSLVGDLTDNELLSQNVVSLVDSLDAEGTPVTDVFTFQASGMPFAIELDEQFLVPMNEIVISDGPDKDEQFRAKKEELRKRYAVWLPESRPQAHAVNYESKVNIINAFRAAYKGGRQLTFIDFNSIFGKEGVGPAFYDNVLTKHEFSLWLGENATELVQDGIEAAEITAPVVEDTDVGRVFLNKVNPLLVPELQVLIVRTKVKRVDVFQAMKEFIDMAPGERVREGRPYHRYVIGDNGTVLIVSTIPEELHIDPNKFDI